MIREIGFAIWQSVTSVFVPMTKPQTDKYNDNFNRPSGFYTLLIEVKGRFVIFAIDDDEGYIIRFKMLGTLLKRIGIFFFVE